MQSKKLGPRLLVGFLTLLLVMFVLGQPSQAAESVTAIGGWLAGAAESVGAFLGSLTG